MMEAEISLVDLHLHLEGAVRLKTVLEISQKHGLNLPAWSEEALQPYA